MPIFQQSKPLPYLARELYQLVLKVEDYPKFLPWCSHARIISKTDEEMTAELVIHFKGFSDKYTSRISSSHGDKFSTSHKIMNRKVGEAKQVQGDGQSSTKFIIEIEAISGPFKHLVSRWEFNEIDAKNCNVSFYIDFEFKNRILNRLTGVFFAKATEKMISAFEHRARQLHSLQK